MKTIILFLAFLCFFSCSFQEYPLDVPKFYTIEAAYSWTSINIKNIRDVDLYGWDEYWASPQNTLKNRAGDCEDKVILFLAIVKDQFNIEGSMLSTYIDPLGFHAIAKVNNNLYDISFHTINADHVITGEYSYNFIMSVAH